ncbi:hypothetical protein SAMN05414139_01569 [Burkholderia sp. D7]|nr:hypothetical protein SAMN05414139_01569 [Burkholderia sp. D7]
MTKRHLRILAATSYVILAGCGGGGNDTPASAPGPALADNVLISTGLAANGVIATINRAGFMRVYGSGTGQALTLGLGTVPMTGDANSATGNGWIPSSGTFVQRNATLSLNSGGKAYSLKVQGATSSASDSMLALNTILVKPTVSSLAGTFGMTSSTRIVIAGNSFSGTYGYSCTWSGNLTPQTNTIDVTDIQFETATQGLNLGANPCPYVGKSFTGTAFLMGPSAAYPKGVFAINWDDGGSNMPTSVNEMYFIRQ